MRPVARAALAAAAMLAAFSAGSVEVGSQVLQEARLDADGVLRWRDGQEVALLGVNYYAPFCVDWQGLAARGVDMRQTIDRDLEHLARLNLDVIRLHVFDREISDPAGNLVDNEHLEAFDYLVAGAAARGMYTVLTPIAWWGTPNPHDGFSDRFTMHQMTTDPVAWEAQCRYLAQFLGHVNRYTGHEYKAEPGIVAIELINEPLYPAGTTDADITRYIDTLAGAVRGTGCEKPIFYNGWGPHYDAVRDAQIEGCSFNWYPTGLAAGRSLLDNYLTRVDDYPDMRSEALAKKAKIVYEFDAADVPGSYLYPAMARSFRSGGAQIATMFTYDPAPLADANSSWHTHYVNLAYTPNKALSLMIAREVFHRIPRLARFGTYPENARFDVFRVDHAANLSEMATDTDFLYTTDTDTTPPNPAALRRVAGCGRSPVVRYTGSGAYFLDRVRPGQWRLEVYPDTVAVRDPFEFMNPPAEAVRVLWREREMTITLPDLGNAFSVHSSSGPSSAEGGRFPIPSPGIYTLYSEHSGTPESRPAAGQFWAPPDRGLPIAVHHRCPEETGEGKPLVVRCAVASSKEPLAVTLHWRGPGTEGFKALAMAPTGPAEFEAVLPSDVMTPGLLEYYINVSSGAEDKVFPLGAPVSVEPATPVEPLVLFRPMADAPAPEIRRGGVDSAHVEAAFVPGAEPARGIHVAQFGPTPSAVVVVEDAADSTCLSPSPPASIMANPAASLVLRARSIEPATTALEVGLLEESGRAYGCVLPLTPVFRESVIPLRKLYPLWETPGGELDVSAIDRVSFGLGAWLFGEDYAKPHGVEVAGLAIRSAPAVWSVTVLAKGSPVRLFDAERNPLHIVSAWPYKTAFVEGMTPEALALRVSVENFDSPPCAVGITHSPGRDLDPRRDDMIPCDTVRLRVRAARPETTQVEFVLTERDGTPWGTEVPLEAQWREVSIPLKDLRLFRHWSGVPAGRGESGDAIRPGEVSSIHITFGAWLYPGTGAEPHAYDIQSVTLAREQANAPHTEAP